jgi:hypothetical protein
MHIVKELCDIQRLTGDLVAALVEEFGPWNAADLFEATAEEVRLAGDNRG